MNNTKNKTIKLVIAVNDFRVGGAQKLIADIILNMDHARFEIHLVTMMQHENQPTFYDSISETTQIHKLQFKSFKDISSWIGLYRLLRIIKPNVVWTNLFFSNTVFRILKPLFKYKVIATEHNTYLKRTNIQKLLNKILTFFTYKVVVVSKFLNDHVIEQGIPSNKIIVIQNGVKIKDIKKDFDSYDKEDIKSELGFSKEDKLIINIGQMIKQKNQALLMEAFAVFSNKRQHYKLVILGDGVLRQNLKDQVDKLELTDKVFLPGIQKNVSKYFAASDFYVLTSDYEGFPIVILESLACGMPIISTPVSSSDEYLDNNKNGFIVTPKVSELVKAMVSLSDQSAEDRERFSNHSLEIAKQFDIEIAVKSYEQLFNAAIVR